MIIDIVACQRKMSYIKKKKGVLFLLAVIFIIVKRQP